MAGAGGASTCQPPATCSQNGSTCSAASDCCSGTCDAGTCRPPCVGTSGACTVGGDCCAGLTCDVPAGATSGTCGTGGLCAFDGEACSAAVPCCGAPEEVCDAGVCTVPQTCGGVAQSCVTQACCQGLACVSSSTNGSTVPCLAEDPACFCDTPLACKAEGEACDASNLCCTGNYCASNADPNRSCDDPTLGCHCVSGL